MSFILKRKVSILLKLNFLCKSQTEMRVFFSYQEKRGLGMEQKLLSVFSVVGFLMVRQFCIYLITEQLGGCKSH